MTIFLNEYVGIVLINKKEVTIKKIGTIKNAIWQFPFKNIEEIIYKTNRYSTLGVKKLEEKGVKILGTSVDAIDLAEDRKRFKSLIKKLKLIKLLF